MEKKTLYAPPYLFLSLPTPCKEPTKIFLKEFSLHWETAEVNFKDNMVYVCAGISNHPFFGWLEKLRVQCPMCNQICMAPHCFEQFQILSNLGYLKNYWTVTEN